MNEEKNNKVKFIRVKKRNCGCKMRVREQENMDFIHALCAEKPVK